MQRRYLGKRKRNRRLAVIGAIGVVVLLLAFLLGRCTLAPAASASHPATSHPAWLAAGVVGTLMFVIGVFVGAAGCVAVSLIRQHIHPPARPVRLDGTLVAADDLAWLDVRDILVSPQNWGWQ